jgi:hypothetical protein
MKSKILFLFFLLAAQIKFLSQSSNNSQIEDRINYNKLNNLNEDEGFVYETIINLVSTKQIKTSEVNKIITEYFVSKYSAQVLNVSSKKKERFIVNLNFYRSVNVALLKEDIYSIGFIITDFSQQKTLK